MAWLVGKVNVREIETGKTFRFPCLGREIEVTIEDVDPLTIVTYPDLPGEVSWEEAGHCQAIEIWYDSPMINAFEIYAENLAGHLGCEVEELGAVTAELADENPEYLANCQNSAEAETWQELGGPTDTEYEEFLALRDEAGS
jgi:hypothetical protein